MKLFSQHIPDVAIEQLFEEQHLNLLLINEENKANQFGSDDIVEKDTDEGNKHLWKNLRAGANEYFNAPPEHQKRLQDEAIKVYRSAMKNKTDHGILLGNEASNPKLAKSGEAIPEYVTKGLSLAPADMSGIEVCPSATPECRTSCLGKSAGRTPMSNVKSPRINKTRFMNASSTHFYAMLDKEISNGKRTAARNGQKLAVRLNVLSDIPHEQLAPQLFQKHHDVQFYDYTKIKGRPFHKNMPSNYHLTLSSTGVNHDTSNWDAVKKHLDRGGVSAMVFRVTGKNAELPTHVHDESTGKTYPVVDGDIHDHRHLDHKFNGIPDGTGIIAGLRVKGGKPNLARAGNFAVPVNADGTATVKAK